MKIILFHINLLVHYKNNFFLILTFSSIKFELKILLKENKWQSIITNQMSGIIIKNE